MLSKGVLFLSEDLNRFVSLSYFVASADSKGGRERIHLYEGIYIQDECGAFTPIASIREIER